MSIVSKDGNWMYEENDDGTIELSSPLTSNVNKEGKVVIPDTIDGKKVTDLRIFCFVDCDKLEQMIIPKTVERISSYCFENCTSLQFIYLPKNVIGVGDYVFKNCTSLHKLYTDGQKIKWGDDCFQGCTITEQDVIPGGCWW